MSANQVQSSSEAVDIEKTDIQSIVKSDNVCRSNETLIHAKARDADFENVSLLIEAGLNVNARNHLGRTPIMLAMESIRDGRDVHSIASVKVIDILYRANADIDISDNFFKNVAQSFLDDSNNNEYTAKVFLEIIHRECMKKSLNTTNQLIDLHCSLWQAVLLENAEVIEDMILRGCQTHGDSYEYWHSALHRATELMNLEIVKVLIKYDADANAYDYKRLLPIAYYGFPIPGKIQQPEIIKLLLDKTTRLKNMHIHNLLRQFKRPLVCGNKKVIQLLLEYRSDVFEFEGTYESTALHFLSGNYNDISDVLRNREVNVNGKDIADRTPIFMAVENPYSHINTIKFLLEKGADVNAQTIFTFDEFVPLFSLCSNHSIAREKYYKIIEMFLEYGLDVQIIGPNRDPNENLNVTVFDIINVNKSFYMAEPLLTHLAILDESQQSIVELIRNKINSYKVFKNYFNSCKAELAKMKHSNITENYILYRIMVDKKCEEQVLKKYRFKLDLASNFNEMKTKFEANSYFNTVVQKRISSIVLNLELFEKAGVILCELLEFTNDPNHLVIAEIIDYLGHQDLQNLLKVEI